MMPFQHPPDNGLEDDHGAELGPHQDQAEQPAAQEPEPVAPGIGPEFGEQFSEPFHPPGPGPEGPGPLVLAGHLHPDAGGAGLCLRRRDGAGRFGGAFFRGAGIGSLSDMSNS